jgi:D-alanyl-D-alanine carboxypeptidase (penicillin-binding protein 5/6)
MLPVIKKISFWTCIFLSLKAFAIPLPESPNINSESYTLIDFDTGEILLSNKEDVIYPPASITKLMTAYTILKEIDRGIISKDNRINVSSNAFMTAKNTKSSRMFLEINDNVTVDDMLKGLIVQSGNDAAIAIAEHVSGTEENFSNIMNHYAKLLDMNNSNFRNASGLPQKDHYSTSRDLALLMRALIKEFPEEYTKYFSMKEFSYNNINQPSRNQLLFRESHVEGGKTGWTVNANYCYVASFFYDNRRLIVSTLSAPEPEDRFEDAIALSNYGFKFFENYKIIDNSTYITGLKTMPVFRSDINNAKVLPKDDVILTLPLGEIKNVKAKISVKDKLVAPMNKGVNVGEVKIYYKNQQVASTKIILAENIQEGQFYNVMIDELLLKLK